MAARSINRPGLPPRAGVGVTGAIGHAPPTVAGGQAATQSGAALVNESSIQQQNKAQSPAPNLFITKPISTPYGTVNVSYSAEQIGGRTIPIAPKSIVSGGTFSIPTSSSQNGFNVAGNTTYQYQIIGKNLQPVQTGNTGTISYNGVNVATYNGNTVTATNNPVAIKQFGNVGTQNENLGTIIYLPTVTNNQVGLSYSSFQSANVTYNTTVPLIQVIKGVPTETNVGIGYVGTTTYNPTTGTIGINFANVPLTLTYKANVPQNITVNGQTQTLATTQLTTLNLSTGTSTIGSVSFNQGGVSGKTYTVLNPDLSSYTIGLNSQGQPTVLSASAQLSIAGIPTGYTETYNYATSSYSISRNGKQFSLNTGITLPQAVSTQLFGQGSTAIFSIGATGGIEVNATIPTGSFQNPYNGAQVKLPPLIFNSGAGTGLSFKGGQQAITVYSGNIPFLVQLLPGGTINIGSAFSPDSPFAQIVAAQQAIQAARLTNIPGTMLTQGTLNNPGEVTPSIKTTQFTYSITPVLKPIYTQFSSGFENLKPIAYNLTIGTKTVIGPSTVTSVPINLNLGNVIPIFSYENLGITAINLSSKFTTGTLNVASSVAGYFQQEGTSISQNYPNARLYLLPNLSLNLGKSISVGGQLGTYVVAGAITAIPFAIQPSTYLSLGKTIYEFGIHPVATTESILTNPEQGGLLAGSFLLGLLHGSGEVATSAKFFTFSTEEPIGSADIIIKGKVNEAVLDTLISNIKSQAEASSSDVIKGLSDKQISDLVTKGILTNRAVSSSSEFTIARYEYRGGTQYEIISGTGEITGTAGISSIGTRAISTELVGNAVGSQSLEGIGTLFKIGKNGKLEVTGTRTIPSIAAIATPTLDIGFQAFAESIFNRKINEGTAKVTQVGRYAGGKPGGNIPGTVGFREGLISLEGSRVVYKTNNPLELPAPSKAYPANFNLLQEGERTAAIESYFKGQAKANESARLNNISKVIGNLTEANYEETGFIGKIETAKIRFITDDKGNYLVYNEPTPRGRSLAIRPPSKELVPLNTLKPGAEETISYPLARFKPNQGFNIIGGANKYNPLKAVSARFDVKIIGNVASKSRDIVPVQETQVDTGAGYPGFKERVGGNIEPKALGISPARAANFEDITHIGNYPESLRNIPAIKDISEINKQTQILKKALGIKSNVELNVIYEPHPFEVEEATRGTYFGETKGPEELGSPNKFRIDIYVNSIKEAVSRGSELSSKYFHSLTEEQAIETTLRHELFHVSDIEKGIYSETEMPEALHDTLTSYAQYTVRYPKGEINEYFTIGKAKARFSLSSNGVNIRLEPEGSEKGLPANAPQPAPREYMPKEPEIIFNKIRQINFIGPKKIEITGTASLSRTVELGKNVFQESEFKGTIGNVKVEATTLQFTTPAAKEFISSRLKPVGKSGTEELEGGKNLRALKAPSKALPFNRNLLAPDTDVFKAGIDQILRPEPENEPIALGTKTIRKVNNEPTTAKGVRYIYVNAGEGGTKIIVEPSGPRIVKPPKPPSPLYTAEPPQPKAPQINVPIPKEQTRPYIGTLPSSIPRFSQESGFSFKGIAITATQKPNLAKAQSNQQVTKNINSTLNANPIPSGASGRQTFKIGTVSKQASGTISKISTITIQPRITKTITNTEQASPVSAAPIPNLRLTSIGIPKLNVNPNGRRATARVANATPNRLFRYIADLSHTELRIYAPKSQQRAYERLGLNRPLIRGRKR